MALQVPAAKARASRRGRPKGLSFRLFVSLFLSSFFLSQPLFAQAQQAANLQVGHYEWTFRDGAPVTIYALAQASDGALWVSGESGLFRFDGVRFETFRSPFGDELLSTNIYSLLSPVSGGLWIGYTFGGFSFVKDGRVKNYPAASGSVWGLAEGHDGTVWAATSSGVWRFEHSAWQHLGAEWNAPTFGEERLRFDREGTLWVIAQERLFVLRSGERQFQVALKYLPTNDFVMDADGYVVTERSTGQARLDSNGVRLARLPVLGNRNTAVIDRTNSVWVVASDKRYLTRLPPSVRLAESLKSGSTAGSQTFQVDPYFTSRLVDREGNVWFGTLTGLDRFFYSPLIKQELPTPPDLGITLAAADRGAIWVGTNDERNISIQRIFEGKTETLLKQKSRQLCFIYRAQDKTLWFGGIGGLWRLSGRNLVHIDLPPEMLDQSQFLQSITQDQHGGMWVSLGRHGLYRLADGVWTPNGGREDLPNTGVIIEFTDYLGRVWFGYTKNTLAVLDGDHVKIFGPNDGLRVGNITAIYGRGATIWIGGEFGLQQYDQGQFHTINAVNDEWLRGISGIVETANGDLWLNGIFGVFHISGAEVSNALKSPTYQLKGEHFGRRDGLSGFAAQLRPLPTAIQGTDGRVWFALTNGLVWVDPMRAEHRVVPPPARIESVSANGKFYQSGSTLRFPAQTSDVQIGYAAVSLSDPDAIHFRYKLEETDRDWHEVATASPVTYRNLPPGLYHFRVDATDTNGVWSDKVAIAEFTILPAFYQTAWFRVLCLAAFLALLWALYQLRLRQLDRQFHVRLEERVNERTRIARDLHDTLLQTFQGLLLQFRALTYQLPDRSEFRKMLENLIDKARAAITEGRDAVQGLRASTVVGNDLAQSINALGEELAADPTVPHAPDFQVLVEGTPRNLVPILRDEVYQIAGEAMRNAFRHAHAKRIEVEIHYDDRQFQMLIRDDGKGFDPKSVDRKERIGHFGLHGMRERVELIRGNLELRSKVQSGTEIKLTILASAAYAGSTARRFRFLRRRTPMKSGEDARPI